MAAWCLAPLFTVEVFAAAAALDRPSREAYLNEACRDDPALRADAVSIATQTITLTGPDSYTMTGVTQFFNAGREVVRTGCASRVAQRFR